MLSKMFWHLINDLATSLSGTPTRLNVNSFFLARSRTMHAFHHYTVENIVIILWFTVLVVNNKFLNDWVTISVLSDTVKIASKVQHKVKVNFTVLWSHCHYDMVTDTFTSRVQWYIRIVHFGYEKCSFKPSSPLSFDCLISESLRTLKKPK